MASKKKSLISLDIGNIELKAVHGIVSNRVKIDASVSLPVPNGCYDNGTITDKSLFIQLIKQLMSEFRIKKSDVAISFESNEVIKREIIVPKVEESDMASLIQYEITEYLPIEIENYVMQHKIIGVEEDNKLKVMVVAIPKAIVTGFFDCIKEAGLNPIVMDIHSNGLESMVESSSTMSDSNYALMDIGEKFTNISVFENGNFVFNRIINKGISIFDESVKKYIDENSTFEGIKRSIKIPEIWSRYRFGDMASMDMDDDDRVIFEEIVMNMDILLDEIDKVLKYYLNRQLGNKIDKIRIYGGGAMMTGMCDAFERKFERPTSILDLSDFVDIPSQSVNPLFVNAVSVLVGGL